MPHFMIVLIPYINLLNLFLRIKCLFLRNMEPLIFGIEILFSDFIQVCLFVLRFYSPINPVGSCRARSIYLTTLSLGRLSTLSG